MSNIIVGIDEAGRGPLAGRVYAAAVVLDPERPIAELNDSKKISEKKRNLLFEKIINHSLSYSIQFASEQEIDKINILQATFLAMKRALEDIKTDFNYVMVDGNHFPFYNEHAGEAVIKGDSKIPEIMAASILAKVSRDNYMLEMDGLYPQYQFSRHKGYPTKEHKKLIEEHGPAPIHRLTFKGVKEFTNKNERKTLWDG